MSDGPLIRFEHFLEQFPELELPMTFTEETVRAISRETPPLSPRVIDQFILPVEPGMADELTEFVACLRLPEADEYAGVVYWRADLAQYHYTLVTFNPNTQELIDRMVIAGTSYDGAEVLQSQAVLTEALVIYQVSGQSGGGDYDYQAASSTARRFQIAESGKIVEL
ncbi:hypothetical protein QWY85_20085 [Neolewinella lacunae]|uniref:Uncharacterized protein n=1 Tax=Neolewinella lacunae TaxID=1517758 RepID=A0A923TAN0_9BACT|nr:hypothetical protein [Neolewinella lacunae]MBC6996358.1 hypothetical protein [Neolewinella lacunae]MDN3636981.1 hypothetical protein [Neolewinella lacunae]